MGILGVLFSSSFGHLKCFCKNKLLNDLNKFYSIYLLDFRLLEIDFRYIKY